MIWDDENTDNQNEVGGNVPEGLYSDDTKIYFCCKTDGFVDRPIHLPIESDFLLFAYHSTKCQKVCFCRANVGQMSDRCQADVTILSFL